MENNKKNNTSNTNSNKNNNNDVEAYNDQLGENASEEFRSESYDNALENNSKSKTTK